MFRVKSNQTYIHYNYYVTFSFGETKLLVYLHMKIELSYQRLCRHPPKTQLHTQPQDSNSRGFRLHMSLGSKLSTPC